MQQANGPRKDNFTFWNAASRLSALLIFHVLGVYLGMIRPSRLARRASFIRRGPKMRAYSCAPKRSKGNPIS